MTSSCKEESCPMDTGTIVALIFSAGILLNIFLLILRILYRKPPADGTKLTSTFWFIVFFEVQFWTCMGLLGVIFGLIMGLFGGSQAFMYYWNGLTVGKRITNYLMEWLGLVALDLVLWKAWCVLMLSIIIATVLITFVCSLGGMWFFLIYILGYTI